MSKEETKTPIQKAFDPFFDKAWKDYVNQYRKQSVVSNHRLFKILIEIKGLDFVTDLKSLIKQMDISHTRLRVSRVAKGVCLKDRRFKTITHLYIDRCQGSELLTGFVYIQVKEFRFIKLHF